MRCRREATRNDLQPTGQTVTSLIADCEEIHPPARPEQIANGGFPEAKLA